jgi:molybdopterin molybdotransferase
MIPVAEAIRIVKEQTRPLSSEQIPLAQALGRVLAEDIITDSDLPAFNRAQMDGYAVRAENTVSAPVRLRIVGESVAGQGWHHEMQAGEAVRIMTGAPVPSGADSVQQVELTREIDKGFVEILEPVALGRSIVRRGTEVQTGETVLHAGARINAAMMAVLAAFGYAKVRAGRRPRVAVLATGSELVPADQEPGQDQIRDSNNYSIAAYAELAGSVVESLRLAGDSTQLLKRRIAEAADKSDVVVTSGGVSMGIYDFTKATLKELEAQIFFERVSLRPGKPTVFARLPNGTLVFGLPGNPVSASVTFNLFARTALLAMQGSKEPAMVEEWAVLTQSAKGSIERESYLPAQLQTSKDGQLLAEPLKWGGSSDFVAFARANALIIVPQGVKALAENSRVNIIRLPTV